MNKIYLALSRDEWLSLSKNAEMECRHPRDHARYLLRQALGITSEDSTVIKTQNDAGFVRQDKVASVAL